MALSLHTNTAWVETDGSFGVSDVILFDPSDLTDQQWETLGDLRDSERLDYVNAIMAGEPLDQWEED